MAIKVYRLVWDYPEGGKPTYGLQPVYYYLSKEQVRQGYEVHIITHRSGSQSMLELQDGVVVHRVDTPFNLNTLKMLLKLIKLGGTYVVHTHATCGFFTSFLKKALHIPLVCHVHSTSQSHFMPVRLEFESVKLGYSSVKLTYYKLRERMLWASADRVLTVSRAISKDLVDFYRIDEDKIKVVYNGVDTELFHPIPQQTPPKGLEHLEGRRVVLYVGHFGLRKGILYLIRAMRTVIKEVSNAVLVCVGGVPPWLGGKEYWKLLTKEIARNNLNDYVYLLDRIPNQMLPSYYSWAEVLVLPSYYEAFGKVVVEAMACGKPVIATRMGGLKEVVQDGFNGLLVDFGSVGQLANALITLLQNPKLAVEMGKRGREMVEREFTWRAVAQRINIVYNEVLSKF